MAEPRKPDFLVRVRRRGSPVRELAVDAPERAWRMVDRLAARPEITEVCWMVRPGLGGPVRLCGRYRADIPGIGETRRVAHVFLLVPGEPIRSDEPMTARCGEPIRSDQLDIVGPGTGMPCYRCTARLPDVSARAPGGRCARTEPAPGGPQPTAAAARHAPSRRRRGDRP